MAKPNESYFSLVDLEDVFKEESSGSEKTDIEPRICPVVKFHQEYRDGCAIYRLNEHRPCSPDHCPGDTCGCEACVGC